MKEGKVETNYWQIDLPVDKNVDKLCKLPEIMEASELIKCEEVVAFPTETVYGLGADALSVKATSKIFEAKGRPSDNPLIVHIATYQQLEKIVDNLNEWASILMNKFWPGPLTLVLPKKQEVCSTVTAGLSTVAVRMPDHPIALALIKASGKALAAPSANCSGKPSPTSAQHVLEDLNGRISGILDGGETGVGIESTVVDVTGTKPMILRPGGITKEQLEEVVGEVLIDPALAIHVTASSGKYPHNYPQRCGQMDESDRMDSVEGLQPRSPGVKYQHYAPDGELYLASLEAGMDRMSQIILDHVQHDRSQGEKVAVLATEENVEKYVAADLVLNLGSRGDLSTVAQKIYQVLRICNQEKITKIYSESFPRFGIGDAIMNRLEKASGGNWVE